jgi:hypothetical protein
MVLYNVGQQLNGDDREDNTRREVKNGTAQLWTGRPPYGQRRAGNHDDGGKQRKY